MDSYVASTQTFMFHVTLPPFCQFEVSLVVEHWIPNTKVWVRLKQVETIEQTSPYTSWLAHQLSALRCLTIPGNVAGAFFKMSYF